MNIWGVDNFASGLKLIHVFIYTYKKMLHKITVGSLQRCLFSGYRLIDWLVGWLID